METNDWILDRLFNQGARDSLRRVTGTQSGPSCTLGCWSQTDVADALKIVKFKKCFIRR